MTLSAAERLRIVGELFELASGLSHDQREALLMERTEDEDLRREVRVLLAVAESGPGFLETPPLAVNRLREISDAAFAEPGGDSPSSAMIGRRIAGYRIVSCIASGGMGVVYEAEQDSPRRTVALKVIRPELMSPQTLARFRREAELLGRLQHPGIAAVHEAGSFQLPDDPPTRVRPFCAMELVEGTPINRWVEERRLARDEVLELMAQVCDAIDHAHLRGVIHRDIKARNVLVTPAGQPKVLDFGIARDISAEPDATLQTTAGDIVGTLGSMSPEQLRGANASIDARSDVYALGLLAYELLAQRPAFDLRSLSVAQAMNRLLEDEPAPLGAVRSELRGDISVVVGKAIDKDPARRYPTATAFGADLRRIVARRPVVAAPPTRLYRLRKFIGRHTLETAAVALAALLLVGGVLATSIGWSHARREAERRTAVNSFLRGMIGWLDPGVVGGADVSLRDAVDATAARAARELVDQPREAAEVHALLGERYSALGAGEPARGQYQLALVRLEQGGGGDELFRADMLASLGSVLTDLGGVDEAIRLHEEALTIRRAQLDAGDVRIAESLHNLSVAYRMRGDARHALECVRAAIDIVRRDQPKRLAELSWSLAHMGTVLLDLGRIDEAIAASEEAVGLREHIQQDDLQTAKLMERFAVVLAHDAGSRPRAAEMLRRCVDIRRQLLPADRPELLDAQRALAELLMEQGELVDAVTLLEESRTALRRSAHWSDDGEIELLDRLVECHRLRGAEAERAEAEARIQVLRSGNEP